MSLRERILGDKDRLGWWIVPLFVMVGLGGAVIAGSLAVVYYAQQVSSLEQETRGAREDLVGAVDEVREAADDALESISEEVSEVQETLAQGLPLEDALEVGVVRLEVDIEVPDDRPVPEPDQQESLSAPEDEDENGDESDDEDADDEDADEGEAEEEQAPQQQTRDPIPVRRAASGFVVVSDGEEVFIATSLELLDDPRRDEAVPIDTEATVRLPGGSTEARVHSWDDEADLLLLRASISDVEPLPWRPEDEPLEPGARVVAVGATPQLGPVRIGGEVAAVTGVALVTDLPALQLTSGGPVVDIEGRVVGVGSQRHSPLGQDPVVVPVRTLCERMLSSCPD